MVQVASATGSWFVRTDLLPSPVSLARQQYNHNAGFHHRITLAWRLPNVVFSDFIHLVSAARPRVRRKPTGLAALARLEKCSASLRLRFRRASGNPNRSSLSSFRQMKKPLIQCLKARSKPFNFNGDHLNVEI
jgi:hypothetical protein